MAQAYGRLSPKDAGLIVSRSLAPSDGDHAHILTTPDSELDRFCELLVPAGWTDRCRSEEERLNDDSTFRCWRLTAVGTARIATIIAAQAVLRHASDLATDPVRSRMRFAIRFVGCYAVVLTAMTVLSFAGATLWPSVGTATTILGPWLYVALALLSGWLAACWWKPIDGRNTIHRLGRIEWIKRDVKALSLAAGAALFCFHVAVEALLVLGFGEAQTGPLPFAGAGLLAICAALALSHLLPVFAQRDVSRVFLKN